MWSNCGRKSSKSFKRLFKRPDFLPLSSEISSQNWLFISNKYEHKFKMSGRELNLGEARHLFH